MDPPARPVTHRSGVGRIRSVSVSTEPDGAAAPSLDTDPPHARRAARSRGQEPEDITAAQLPNLESIRRFVVVAEELSFTRAARRLNVVQQTLSEGIAHLANTLGLRLFERATRRVAVTD